MPGEYYSLFRDIDPSSGFENDIRPFNPMNENNKEDARRVYAMVKNIDDNIGKILQKLGELNLDENTNLQVIRIMIRELRDLNYMILKMILMSRTI